MRSIEIADQHRLRAAVGWLELGNPEEAAHELETIRPELLEHPDVLEIRWQIDAAERRWAVCVDVAEALLKLKPDRPGGWIHRAFALHELKRTEAALESLLPVADRFPEIWTIPYNLACYCAQLGRLGQAGVWLRRAFEIAERKGNKKELQDQALEDPDLQPLRRKAGIDDR